MSFTDLKESHSAIEAFMKDIIEAEQTKLKKKSPDIMRAQVLENIRYAEIARFALRLFFEINSNLDSLAVTYREMLELTKARSGVADHGKKANQK